jgi:uncharacterized protein
MRHLFFLLLFVFAATAARAQVPYNVVFDLTSKDTNDHKMVLRWINGISSGKPDARLEVVLFGQSLDMVRKEKTSVEASLLSALQNKNVTVKVCAGTLKRLNIDPSELLPGVGIVPDGIYQIITRQSEGWGYIKAGH